MAENSNISWCHHTWNIARGCTKVDSDCKFCYMYRDSFDSTRYDPLNVVRTKGVFGLPLRIKEPSKIFTCSLTDFFHEAIDSYRNEAWDIIRKCPQHTFQILTKRPERITQCLPEDWGNGWDNVWLGTSVGSKEGIIRLEHLMEVKTKIRFLSAEPLYTELDIDNFLYNRYHMGGARHMYNKLDWVICGGESGNETGKYRYRPCELQWIEKIVVQCKLANVPLFVKQLGTHLQKQMKLKARHGTDIYEFPEHLRIREFPFVK